VKAVIKCTGNLIDNASHVYMQFLTRQTFWKNRNSLQAEVVLRNANYRTGAVPSLDAAGNTFLTSAKGFASFEIRWARTLAAR